MPRRHFVLTDVPAQDRHQSYKEPIEGRYHFDRYNGPLTSLAKLDAYRAMTKELMAIVEEAVDQGKELRVHGSEWSLSKVGLAEHRLINPKMLSRIVFSLPKAQVSTRYAGDHKKLRFFEAGVSISAVNQYLFNADLSMKASGSNDGQTLVGALSTGTHGSAFDFGGIPEFVVGLHIVTGPNKHVYLQRESTRVMRKSFADSFSAEFVQNDDAFNAALVSFGSFGIIQGVMIEARELFVLHGTRFRHPFNAGLKKAATKLDFSGIDLSKSTLPASAPTSKPYHFQLYFNPNEGTPPSHATVFMMFEGKFPDRYRPPVWDQGAPGPGASGLELIGSVFDAIPSPLHRAVVPDLNRAIQNRLHDHYDVATLGDFFRGEKSRGRLQVTGTALPMEHCLDALDIAFTTYRDMNILLPVIISSRFVKGSKALLGFTKFPKSCTLELDTIRTKKSEAYLKKVRQNLHAAGIPFTVHWGKMESWLTPARVRAIYADALTKWKASRDELMQDDASKAVFTNDFMRRLGLE